MRQDFVLYFHKCEARDENIICIICIIIDYNQWLFILWVFSPHLIILGNFMDVSGRLWTQYIKNKNMCISYIYFLTTKKGYYQDIVYKIKSNYWCLLKFCRHSPAGNECSPCTFNSEKILYKNSNVKQTQIISVLKHTSQFWIIFKINMFAGSTSLYSPYLISFS